MSILEYVTYFTMLVKILAAFFTFKNKKKLSKTYDWPLIFFNIIILEKIYNLNKKIVFLKKRIWPEKQVYLTKLNLENKLL